MYEADPRHVEKLLKEAGMEGCKPLSTPGLKEPTNPEKAWFEGEAVQSEGPETNVGGGAPADKGLGPDGSPYISRSEMSDYRSAVARCN